VSDSETSTAPPTASPWAPAPALPPLVAPLPFEYKYGLVSGDYTPWWYPRYGEEGADPAANLFSGQYDGPGPSSGGDPLKAAAGGLGEHLKHPFGSPFGLDPGKGAFQYAPKGGILPGLLDVFKFKPYIEGVPGMGPPGMPPPWQANF
jgi:hypothetical protein